MILDDKQGVESLKGYKLLTEGKLLGLVVNSTYDSKQSLLSCGHVHTKDQYQRYF